MKLVIAFFLVLSQLLGANVNASERTDSGDVHGVLRHIERLQVTAGDFVIDTNGLSLEDFNLIGVEDESEEVLYKKLISPGRLLFLCPTANSIHYYPSFSASPFLCRPLVGASSCRYILHRVLRI